MNDTLLNIISTILIPKCFYSSLLNALIVSLVSPLYLTRFVIEEQPPKSILLYTMRNLEVKLFWTPDNKLLGFNGYYLLVDKSCYAFKYI